jgi:hypothetical protein
MSLIWQDYATEDRQIRLWRQQNRKLIRVAWGFYIVVCLGAWWALGHVVRWLWWIWKG